jgi:hypothetical protein
MRSVRDEEMVMCFSKKEGQVWLRNSHWLHIATWLIGNPPFGHEQLTHSPRRLAIFSTFRGDDEIANFPVCATVVKILCCPWRIWNRIFVVTHPGSCD